LIGQGPKFKNIKQSSDTLDNLITSGWLNISDLRSILSKCSAGILPWNSIDNAMPNKFFDYASAGLPVISSAQGELESLIIKERIGETFKMANLQTFLHGVKNISEETQTREAYSKNINRLFNDNFAEDIVYTKYSEYVEEITKKN
jgi:glycosyltransferase involved in cell wall biosynthesis